MSPQRDGIIMALSTLCFRYKIYSMDICYRYRMAVGATGIWLGATVPNVRDAALRMRGYSKSYDT